MVIESLPGRPTLVALPPPPPPSDLTPSALFLPLHKISTTEHQGRKLRFVGQILAFHPQTSLVLLTSFPAVPNSHTPSPTILVNIAVPLLGESGSKIKSGRAQSNISNNKNHNNDHHVYSRNPQRPPAEWNQENGYENRENLSLGRGEWITVVGWLEGDGERMVRKVKTSSSFVKPLPLILEAIHISNARPPPQLKLGRDSNLSTNLPVSSCEL
ncbi:hypothetical protein IAT40_008004 [Kwoniella sp. CBS 6097]